MKTNCSNLYILTTVACQLTECLSEQELEALSADLTALGYMIESLLKHQSICEDHGTTYPKILQGNKII